MAVMRLFLPFLFVTATASAAVPPLLNEVTDHWMDERNRWAFTQFVREFDGDTVAEERVERFDLSRGEARRWELITINGKAPTADQEAAWSKRKNRPRRREPRPLAEVLDLENARVLKEDASTVSYAIPLRGTMAWIFPGEKINLAVTINKQTHALERGRVDIAGPFNIALGLAKIIDLDFDLEIAPDGANGANPTAENAQARGTAYAVVNKLGHRVEYTWSDFTRVTQPPP